MRFIFIFSIALMLIVSPFFYNNSTAQTSGGQKGTVCTSYDQCTGVEVGYFIYPNPAKDVLYVSGINPEAKSFSISDITGKVGLQKNISSVNYLQDVGFLPTGIYFLRIFSPRGVVTKKFVKTN